MTGMNEKLRSLALVAGDECEQHWNMVACYMHFCQVLIEADLAAISRDELEEFVLVAFERRQERFPRVPLLNWAGVYA